MDAAIFDNRLFRKGYFGATMNCSPVTSVKNERAVGTYSPSSTLLGPREQPLDPIEPAQKANQRMEAIDMAIDSDNPSIDGQTPPAPTTLKRGFATMDGSRHRAIASKGGSSVPTDKRSFSRDRELAVRAGRKGGQARVRAAAQKAARDMEISIEPHEIPTPTVNDVHVGRE
jgi:uncharacterized protein